MNRHRPRRTSAAVCRGALSGPRSLRRRGPGRALDVAARGDDAPDTRRFCHFSPYVTKSFRRSVRCRTVELPKECSIFSSANVPHPYPSNRCDGGSENGFEVDYRKTTFPRFPVSSKNIFTNRIFLKKFSFKMLECRSRVGFMTNPNLFSKF